jgi:hypothetical protein
MRFSLRTLLIVMLLAGPVCAFGWKEWQAYQERLAEENRLSELNISWDTAIVDVGLVHISSTNCYECSSEGSDLEQALAEIQLEEFNGKRVIILGE